MDTLCHDTYIRWYLTQNMLRTHEANGTFRSKIKLFVTYSQSKQIPKTDQITEIAPSVRTHF